MFLIKGLVSMYVATSASLDKRLINNCYNSLMRGRSEHKTVHHFVSTALPPQIHMISLYYFC